MPATSSVQLPDFLDFARPLSLRTNRHCRAVTLASEQTWLASNLLDEQERTSLRSMKAGLWAAVCFPTCDLPQLRLATDFMTALLFCGARLARGVVDSDELFDALLHRIRSTMPSDMCRDRFTAAFDDFRAARARFLAYRESNTVPKLDDYIELRRPLSGIPVLLSLIEMAEGLKLSSYDPRPGRLATDVLGLSMDVFSFNNGNTLSLVSVIQAEKGVSVQGAINYAFAHVERAFREFRPASPVDTPASAWSWLRRPSPPSNPVTDEDMRLFLRGVEDIICGTLNWSYETELFFGTKGDEVRQYGPVVLVSPIPQYASASSSPISSIAARRHRSPSPIMVTLESEPPARSESVARTAPPNVDLALLSPPINTWKSRPQSRNEYRPRGRHRPTRSQSAPPTQTSFSAEQMSMEVDVPVLDAGAADHPMSAGVGEHFNPNAYESQRRGRIPVRRNHTMFGAGYTHVSEGMTLRGGELVRPPPPLLRPTTFWRRAHRSGVAAASYSPAVRAFYLFSAPS
ncbi:hypothetical protein MKEN_00173500 [Mycena kentingensis (nom. inval.)]|nr:hypothetical protein MKEN_00173500 [Mycena kentingensis (nom. inval.)]